MCEQLAVNVFADADAVLREIDSIEGIADVRTTGMTAGSTNSAPERWVRGEGFDPIIRSVEIDEARGTAGAIGLLRNALDGRGVLAVNADSWSTIALGSLVDVWDRERPLVAHTGERFAPGCGVVASITPWDLAATLDETPRGLYQAIWEPRMGTDSLQTVSVDGSGYFIDCGTPQRYFAANLFAANQGLGSTVDPTAVVEGSITRCVVWDGAHVRSDERLVDAIRTTANLTIRFR